MYTYVPPKSVPENIIINNAENISINSCLVYITLAHYENLASGYDFTQGMWRYQQENLTERDSDSVRVPEWTPVPWPIVEARISRDVVTAGEGDNVPGLLQSGQFWVPLARTATSKPQGVFVLFAGDLSLFFSCPFAGNWACLRLMYGSVILRRQIPEFKNHQKLRTAQETGSVHACEKVAHQVQPLEDIVIFFVAMSYCML